MDLYSESSISSAYHVRYQSIHGYSNCWFWTDPFFHYLQCPSGTFYFCVSLNLGCLVCKCASFMIMPWFLTFCFCCLLIRLQIFARANKGGTVRVKQTVIVVVVIASLWITFVTTISIFAIDASIRDIIFLIVNYSYVTTVFVMAVVELVLAIYVLGHFKKSPQQVSKSNLKKILKTVIESKNINGHMEFYVDWNLSISRWA